MAQLTRDPTSDITTGGTATKTGLTYYGSVSTYPNTSDPLTSYVQLGTTADSFFTCGFSNFDVPAGSLINWVEVQYYDEEPSSGNNSSTGRIRVNTTYYDHGTTHNVSTTTTARTKRWTTNPAGGNWTVAVVNNDGGTGLNAMGVIGPDSNPIHRVGAIQLVVDYNPPQTISVGAATETDAAQAVTAKITRRVSVTQATETDAAQAITAKKIYTIAVGVASETDAAQALGKSKTKAVSEATETDAAQPLTATKTVAVGEATETDAAQTIAVTVVGEATLYYVIGPSSGWTDPSAAEVKLGQLAGGGAATASGNEAAPTSSQTYTFSSDATGLTANTSYRIAFVWSDGTDNSNVEVSDPFVTLTATQTISVTHVAETDSAQAVGKIKTLAVGRLQRAATRPHQPRARRTRSVPMRPG